MPGAGVVSRSARDTSAPRRSAARSNPSKSVSSSNTASIGTFRSSLVENFMAVPGLLSGERVGQPVAEEEMGDRAASGGLDDRVIARPRADHVLAADPDRVVELVGVDADRLGHRVAVAAE